MDEQKVFSHKVLFQVSFSNGETIFEGKGEYKEIAGLPSPWQRAYRYSLDHKLTITSLSLYTEDGQTFNLPSAGNNPKFKQFSTVEKPLDYNLSRSMARDFGTVAKPHGAVISDWFTTIEAIYSTYKLQIWVDELNPKNSWVLVVKI